MYMLVITKYQIIFFIFISLSIISSAVPSFDLDIQETAVNGPVSSITTYRNSLITYDGVRWRIDDSRMLSRIRYELNGLPAEGWDFNNYEELSGQLVWNYKEKNYLDSRAYSINDQYYSIVRFLYLKNGKIDEELRYAGNGALVGKTTFAYNADGKLLSITERDNAGTTVKQVNYSYTAAKTKLKEDTNWYGNDSAKLIRLYDKNENIYEALGYKAGKNIYHTYYRTNSNGAITAISRNYEGEETRYDISYTSDSFGNWSRKTVKTYITRNGFTVPGESYIDSRSISYREFAAYPKG